MASRKRFCAVSMPSGRFARSQSSRNRAGEFALPVGKRRELFGQAAVAGRAAPSRLTEAERGEAAFGREQRGVQRKAPLRARQPGGQAVNLGLGGEAAERRVRRFQCFARRHPGAPPQPGLEEHGLERRMVEVREPRCRAAVRAGWRTLRRTRTHPPRRVRRTPRRVRPRAGPRRPRPPRRPPRSERANRRIGCNGRRPPSR